MENQHNNNDNDQSKYKGRPNDYDRAVSKRLKERRISLGLSQQTAADALGVSVQQIQKYERAVNRVSGGNVYVLSKLYKVPVEYFFTQSEWGTIMEKVDSPENSVSEKEVIAMVKAFIDIKKMDVRSKLIHLARTMG